MKGLGTNEKELIEIVGPRSNEELQLIRRAYQTEIKRDLISDIKDETGGCFRDSLVALLTDRYELDAEWIMGACKGMGTDEGLLAEIILTRSAAELRFIGEAFMRLFKVDIVKRVLEEVSGDLKNLYKTVLTAPREDTKPESQIPDDIKTLFEAGEGKWGTNEAAFISIIGGSSRPYCEKLFYAYARAHGKSLDSVIHSEMGGNLGKALAMLVTPLEIVFTRKFKDSMEGAGTKDTKLIRLVATQKDRGLRAINATFLQDNGKTLAAWVESECSGDYKRILIKVINSFT